MAFDQITGWLLVAAVLGNGLLVGASLDQTIKQLPTRRRIGVVAFSEYSKAAISGAASPGTRPWASARHCSPWVLRSSGSATGPTGRPPWALWLALVLTVAHSLATARAAPTQLQPARRGW